MGYYNGHNVCTKQKYDRRCGSEYSFKRTQGNKKRFSAGEITEAILLMKIVMMKILIVDLSG